MEYSIESLSDFVGNSSAVSKFREWLREVATDRTYKKRVCFLTGPTGCGKTTLLQCAMKEAGFQIREFMSSDMRVKQGRQLLLQYLCFFDVVSMIHRKQTGIEAKNKSAVIECVENMNGQSSQELYKSIRDMIKKEKTFGVPIVFTGILPFRGKKPLSTHAVFIHMSPRSSKEILSILQSLVKKKPSLQGLTVKAQMEIAEKSGGDVRRLFSFLESLESGPLDWSRCVENMETHEIRGPMASLHRILHFEEKRSIEQLLLDAEVEGARTLFGIHGAYLDHVESLSLDSVKKAKTYTDGSRLLAEASELLGQQNFNDSTSSSSELTELALLYGALGIRCTLEDLAEKKVVSKKGKRYEGGDESLHTPCLYRTLRAHANRHMKLNMLLPLSQESIIWTPDNLSRVAQWLRSHKNVPEELQKIQRLGVLEDKID